MTDQKYNPNDVAINNGNIFGFPISFDEAELILMPIPFDATASLGKGTAQGPDGILNYSTQLDFHHHTLSDAWKQKIFWKEDENKTLEHNKAFFPSVTQYIDELENNTSNIDKTIVDHVNVFQDKLKDHIKSAALQAFNLEKKVGVIGGEHSVPLGLIEALGEKYPDFGILQIDAHCDLRIAYEGFAQSHASIMHNALKCKSVKRLIQVGIRDASPKEMNLATADARISCFTDFYLNNQLFSGTTWQKLAREIVEHLPENVYISFDIDGLTPDHCPNTGTPVPGGLSFNQAQYLLWEIKRQNKTVIGFDLCEVGRSENQIDENVGARILWELCCLTNYK